jgi:lysozyme
MQTKTRQAVAALAVSAAALVGIANHESFAPSTYKDSGGIYTLGYGETKGVVAGQKTTPERALKTLLESADEHAKGMSACISVPLYQTEFDAYLSFTYNVGVGAFCHSTLNKKLNAGDYAGACSELLKWDRVGNQKVAGLTKRRQSEYRTCTNPQS